MKDILKIPAISILILLFTAYIIVSCNNKESVQKFESIQLVNHSQLENKHAISVFKNSCTEHGINISEKKLDQTGRLIIHLKDSVLPQSENNESYLIRSDGENVICLYTSSTRGYIYALQSLYESLFIFNESPEEINIFEEPDYAFRAIKFNLPWNSYREHESLQLHDETLKDLQFWESFLDMMSENRFNTLTLWSVHPWTYMVRPNNYPEACDMSEDELSEWQKYWHKLFGLAKARGIKVFMVNWNIFVSPEFSKVHGVAEYSQHLEWGYNGDGDYSELVQQYNKEVVAQVLEEYPELSGIGVSQNERMKGKDVTEEQWQQWIVNTYFDIVREARPDGEFILRGHTHPAPELTRAAIEENADRLPPTVWVPLKYNWSHGHARPELFYIHGGSESDVWWNPVPENYRVVFTIRNEDFFILRWGSPSFIRQLLTHNEQNEVVGGFIIGSETYIPAKDYITKPGLHVNWKYAFDRQWLFYKLWGRLMFDQATPDLIFENAFEERYPHKPGSKLLNAFDLASQMPLALASYYGATWDFTLYSEGFMSGYRPWRGEKWDGHSPFLSVDDIIDANPIDSLWLNVAEYVAMQTSGDVDSKYTTPIQLANKLKSDGQNVLEMINSINSDNPTLLHEIADIKAWSFLSLYFSAKLEGCVAYEQYKRSREISEKEMAIAKLEKALVYWDQLIDVTSPYFDQMPLLHFKDAYISEDFAEPIEKFSWKALRPQVVRDIELVRSN